MDSTIKSAVVPMRFYANWDVDRTSSSAISRTLSMKFTRLCLTKALATENTFIIAVKLQGYRRILRSNDITIPSSSKLDYALDISFTIQYCHFIKRKSNVLDIIIQRRKKYRNRQIPGFKTLAFGNINLNEVLQFGGSREISMWDTACLKRLSVQDFHAGTIYISNCQSHVGADQEATKWVSKSNRKYGNVLSEEDGEDYTSQEESDFDDFEQRERGRLHTPQQSDGRKSRKKIKQKNIKQKVVALLKKFRIPDEENVSNAAGSTSSRMLPPTELELQEIFEELENISDSGPELEPDKMSIVSNPRPGIRPFFGSKSDILPAIKDNNGHTDDSVVDSDEPDQDSSEGTPAQKDSCFWEQEIPAGASRVETSFPPTDAKANSENFNNFQTFSQSRREKLKHSLTINSITSENYPSYQTQTSGQSSVRSLTSTTKKCFDNSKFLEMMANFDANIASNNLSVVPCNIWLTSSVDFPWIQKIEKTKLDNIYLFDCPNLAEVRTAIYAIIARIQKFCNSNSAAPSTTRVGIFGCDKLLSYVLRTYVDALQNKSCQEWLDYLRFSIIVPPNSAIGRFMGQLPSMESYLESLWRGTHGNLTRLSTSFESNFATLADYQELDECLFLITSGQNMSHNRFFNFSIGEVMLQLESSFSDTDVVDEVDKSQIFVPFISELYMGSVDECSIATKNALDDYASTFSPVVSSSTQNAFSMNVSPPVSPHSKLYSECKEVHVEYWTCPSLSANNTSYLSDYSSTSNTRVNVGIQSFNTQNWINFMPNQNSSKFSLKATVRNLSVTREPTTNMLCILFAKEKKRDKVLQKLGRKTKQKSCNDFINTQSRLVSNVTRMVCSSGGSAKNALSLDVSIDGVAWRRIRYFQVSTQWQTHVKLFPVFF